MLSLYIAAVFAFFLSACGGVDSSSNSDDPSSSSGTSSGGGSSGGSSDLRTFESCKEDFESLTEFCFDGEVYPRCGGEEYDPRSRFCFQNKFYLKCGGDEYHPLMQFCGDDEIPHMRCDGKERDPENEFCFGGNIVPKCAGQNFNPDEEFCFGGTLYQKCNGNEFLPSAQFCFKTKLYPMCKGDEYDPSETACCGEEKMDITGNKFCFNGKPEEKCGNKEYNPSREFCFKSKAYDICGFNQYDPDEQDCFNNAVYWITGCSASEDVKFCSKDGTKIINYGVCELSELMYNVEKQFCHKESGIVRDWCGGKPYDPTTEFCFTARGIPERLCQVMTGHDDFGRAQYEFKEFDPETEVCENGAIVGRSFKQECGDYNEDTHFCCFGNTYAKNNPENVFCYNDELYPRCGRSYQSYGEQPYNPRDFLCYSGVYMGRTVQDTLMRNCAVDGITGHCVHSNGLLRCKQLGNGPDYIIDPLLGMACQANGAITSINTNAKILDYRSQRTFDYDIAQIGTQIWMAENLKIDSVLDYATKITTTYYKVPNHDTLFKEVIFEEMPRLISGIVSNDEVNIDTILHVITVEGKYIIANMEYGISSINPEDTLFQRVTYPDTSIYIFGNDGMPDPPVPGVTTEETYIIRDVIRNLNIDIIGKVRYGIRFDSVIVSSEVQEQVPINIPIGRCYNSNNSNCNTYGRLYSLFELLKLPPGFESIDNRINGIGTTIAYSYSSSIANISSVICPKDFRIPSLEDWQKLSEYAGGSRVAGGRLKDSTSWGSGKGTDSYGFKALPGGYGVSWGEDRPHTYLEQGTRSIWWTSTQRGNDETHYFDMISSDSELRTHYRPSDGSAYVRCVRDAAF